MQKLELLIEENTFGSVRPVEIMADVPIALLVPALVEELRLPQRDLAGRTLAYLIFDAARGLLLPEQMTLLAVGMRSGMRLALRAYPLEDIGSSPLRTGVSVTPSADPLFHSSMTMADAAAVPTVRQHAPMRAVPHMAQPKKKGWTRRAVLLTGSAILATGAFAFGYKAYAAVLTPLLFRSTGPSTALSHATPMPPTQTPQPPASALPTSAHAILTFSGHRQTVRSLSWSADGRQLASGADDARLLLWGMDTVVRQDIALPASVRAVAWSPTGQALMVGSANQVLFLHAQTGTVQARSTAVHRAAVPSVAWTTQHQMQAVSGSLDMLAAVWNTQSYRAQEIFRLHTAAIEAVTWASDGQSVATASHGGVVRVWNAENGQELHGLYLDAQVPLRAAAFAPHAGPLAIGGDDGIIRLWPGLTCQVQGAGQFGTQCMDTPQRLQASSAAIHSLAWSPDGRFLLAGSDDGTFTIWYPAQSQQPLVSMQQNAPVLSVVWSPNSNQLATASGKVVTVWQVQ